jgi:dihydroorotate dehydrogenase electron transfer subunit
MYEQYKIIDIVDEANNVKTFVLDKKILAKPGQFVMLWLPGVSEKPFSLSSENGITVKKLGAFTESLFKLGIGDELFIRGPYGNSFLDFAKEGSKYLIAGGTGTAPLAFFAEWLNENPTVFLGARTEDDLIFENRFKGSDTFISTDDGSHGMKGMVTDLFNGIKIKNNSQFFICGPENMMTAAVSKALEHTQEENIILSLERYMKCGHGICGNCEIGGLRVCVDGPVFSYASIKDNKHFGKFKRSKTGEKIEL